MSLDVVMSLSCLTPVSVDLRFAHLNFSLESFYAKQDGLNKVIIVRQHLQDEKFPEIKTPKKLNVDFIDIKYPLYNKMWSLNYGVKKSKADWVILADADMWCPANYFNNLIVDSEKKNLKWRFAWNTLYYANDKETENIVNGKSWGGETTRQTHHPKRGYSEGGLVLFNRKAYLDMGGCCEFIQELGGCDTFTLDQTLYNYGGFSEKTNRFENNYPVKIYHLEHPQVKKSSRGTRRENISLIHWARNNKQVYDYLKKLTIGGEIPRSVYGKLELLYKKGQII